MPKKNEKKEKAKKKARKKAVGLAAVATAAAVAPQAAEVIVQKAAEPQAIKAPEVEVPQPPRYEYSKPRPLKSIGDLLKGVFGVGTARAQSTGFAQPQPRLPKIGPATGQTITGEAPGTFDTKTPPPPSEPTLTQPGTFDQKPGTQTPPPSTVLPNPPSPADSEAAVKGAKDMLVSFFALTEEQAKDIKVVRVEAVQWGDPSLGLPDGMAHPQVVTPGFRITLEYESRFYVFHSNINGASIKMASQSDADPGPIPPGTRLLPTPPQAPQPLPTEPGVRYLPAPPGTPQPISSPTEGSTREGVEGRSVDITVPTEPSKPSGGTDTEGLEPPPSQRAYDLPSGGTDTQGLEPPPSQRAYDLPSDDTDVPTPPG